MKPVKRGEIWLANLSPTIGREQSGTRPVLVISNDIFNRGLTELVFALPVTSKNKNIRTHVPVNPPEGGLVMSSFIMCEALRSISKQRLLKYQGMLSLNTLREVENILRILIDL